MDERGSQFLATKVISRKHALSVVYESRKNFLVVITFYPVRRERYAYKIKYDDDADVLTVVVKEKGKLSHAEEVGDMILHVDDKGEPLFLEILKASKIVPLMVEGLAKKEVTVA